MDSDFAVREEVGFLSSRQSSEAVPTSASASDSAPFSISFVYEHPQCLDLSGVRSSELALNAKSGCNAPYELVATSSASRRKRTVIGGGEDEPSPYRSKRSALIRTIRTCE